MMTTILIFATLLFMPTNGQEIQRSSVARERVPVADIALLIDQSGSIGALNYEEEIDFARQFVSSFPISENETRIALIEFSLSNMTRVRLDWKHGISLEIVQNTLDEMRHAQLGTGTDFAKAMTVAVDALQSPEAGDRPDAPNIAVMVTDGYLNSKFERNPAFAAARRLRNSGTLFYAIHVKLDPKIHQAPIDDLTEMTGNRSRVFAVEDFKRLSDELLKHITHQITEEYQDCVYEYEPTGLCYRNSVNDLCVQDASLKIIREAQAPYGSPCPAQSDSNQQIECAPGMCQDSCEKWPWGPWRECISDNCGLNGTKMRQRLGYPPYPQLATTCLLIESKPCSKEELDALRCPEGGQAEKVKTGGETGHMPIWAIILVVLAVAVVITLAITGVVLYRSPRWRMVFVPSQHRKNQLPGNTGDNASTNSL